MQYSNLTAMSRGLVLPSPMSGLVAAANGNCLDVYDLDTLSLLHTTTAADAIVHLAWGLSPTFGEVLAAASSPSNSVVVVRVDTGQVVVDVHDSPIAIAGLQLTNRGHLLIAAEHGLSLTIVAVDFARRIAVLPFIKQVSMHGMLYAVSPDDKSIAVVTRKDGIDGICLVALKTGRKTMARRGPDQLAGVTDVAGIQWKSVGMLFWGGASDPLGHHAMALMTPNGRVVMSGDPSSPQAFRMDSEDFEGDGFFVGSSEQCADSEIERKGCGLGINSAAAAGPDGSLIAVGGYDGTLRVINTNSWLQVASFGHGKPEVDDVAPPVIFRERTNVLSESELEEDGENSPRAGNGGAYGRGSRFGKKGDANHSSYFEVLNCDGSVEITKKVRSTSGSNSTKTGVSFAQFSPCGGYLASRCDKAGNVVFVWDVKNLRLFAMLILEEDARCIGWSKPDAISWADEDAEESGDEKDADTTATKGDDDLEPEDDAVETVGPQLAIVSGGEYVYLWRRSGAAAVRVRPAHKWRGEFCARKVAWAHANKALIVADGVSAKAFLAVYPV